MKVTIISKMKNPNFKEIKIGDKLLEVMTMETIPLLVPRIGEHIDAGYIPAPKVLDVVWSKDLKEVFIITE